MQPVRCAAILAGGKSSRMGRDKALILLNGLPLVARSARLLEGLFERVVVVSNSQPVAQAAGLPRIEDARRDKGPLAGIEAALRHFGEPALFVACDCPFLSADFLAFLREAWREELDALVPQSEYGQEPLHAIWSPSTLPAIASALGQQRPPSLRYLLEGLRVQFVPVEEARRFDAGLSMFENWNAPADVRGNGRLV